MKGCGKIINKRFFSNRDNQICGRRGYLCLPCSDKEDAVQGNHAVGSKNG